MDSEFCSALKRQIKLAHILKWWLWDPYPGSPQRWWHLIHLPGWESPVFQWDGWARSVGARGTWPAGQTEGRGCWVEPDIPKQAGRPHKEPPQPSPPPQPPTQPKFCPARLPMVSLCPRCQPAHCQTPNVSSKRNFTGSREGTHKQNVSTFWLISLHRETHGLDFFSFFLTWEDSAKPLHFYVIEKGDTESPNCLQNQKRIPLRSQPM